MKGITLLELLFAKDSSKNTTSVASGKGGTNIASINANPVSNSDSKEADNNKNGLDASPFDFVENECAEAFRQAAQALPMVDGTVDGSAKHFFGGLPLVFGLAASRLLVPPSPPFPPLEFSNASPRETFK